MLSPSRQFRPHRSLPGNRSVRAGFTLVEIVIALAVLGTMAAGCYIGFNSVNTYAVSSRCYSEAQVAAQNQIDLCLSKEPFDVKGAYVSGTFDCTTRKIPVELMTVAEVDTLSSTCGVAFPTAAPTATPVTSSAYYPYYPYYRSGAGQPLSKQAFIYQDPVTGKVIVTGTLTFTVTDTSSTMNYLPTGPGSTPTPLNVRKADVSVTYSYRRVTDNIGNLMHGDYTVRLGTLRTADQ
jgi:prepilin-type N-terminal cleavage/methylation domain-containing protein